MPLVAALIGLFINAHEAGGCRSVEAPALFASTAIRSQSTEKTLIWAGPQWQVYRVADNSTEKECIAEFDTRTGRLIRSIKIRWVPKFVRLVGVPSEGDFAIIDSDASGRFEYMRGPFTSDLRLLKAKVDWVSDVGSGGILAQRGKEDQLGNWWFHRVLCLRQKDASVLWSVPREADTVTNAPRWVGKNVAVGDLLLEGKTGRKLGRFSRDGNRPFDDWVRSFLKGG